MPNERVGIAISKGTFWLLSSQICSACVNFLLIWVLARYLGPKSFGIFAIAFVITQFFSEFGELGLQTGLIQAKELSEEQVHSCFWMNMLSLSVIAVLMYLLAPGFAWVYEIEELWEITRFLAIVLPLDAISAVPFGLLYRKEEFKSVAIVEISSNIGYGIGTLYFVSIGAGVWSLVYGFCFHRIIRTASVLMVTSFRPRLVFSIRSTNNLFRFGLNVTGMRVVNFFSLRSDYLIIGKLLGDFELGLYFIANEICGALQTRFSGVVSRVTYPIFSRLQEDNDSISKIYLKVVAHVASVTFPVLLVLSGTSAEFVQVFYGPQWMGTVPLLRILCVLGCIRSLGTLVGPLILCKGRSDIEFKWSLVMLSGTTAGIWIGADWGIFGVAVGYAMAFFLLLPVIQIIALRLVDSSFSGYLKSLIPAAVASSLAFSVSFYISVKGESYFQNRHVITLFGAASMGFAAYAISYFLIAKRNIMEMVNLFREYRSSKKQLYFK